MVNKIFSRSDASKAEMRLYESHSSIMAELLSHILRMDEIKHGTRPS
jgi:hypothetical protein